MPESKIPWEHRTSADPPSGPAGGAAGSGRGPEKRRGVRHHLRSRLLTGLVVIFPVGFTIWIVYVLFRLLDGLLRPIIDPWLPFHIPGLGLLAVVVFLYLVGVLAANVLGRQILVAAEALILRTPVARPLYIASKQVIDTLRLPGKGAFQKVVLVEYPRRGVWALAFVTGNATRQADGKTLVHLFLPTSPNPTSGMMLILPETEVRSLDMTVEEGIRLVVSGGILSPSVYNLPPRPRLEAEGPGAPREIERTFETRD